MRAVLDGAGAGRVSVCTRLADFQVGFFREHADFGRLLLRASGVHLRRDSSRRSTRPRSTNYTEAMNLQANLFREGQAAGELRAGDPRCSRCCSAA